MNPFSIVPALFKAQLVKRDAAADIAVLKAVDHEFDDSFLPLELAFSTLRDHSKVSFIGTASSSPANFHPISPGAINVSYDNRGRLRGRTNQVMTGDSGSPLFTLNGLVFGILTKRRSNNEIVAVPLSSSESIFVDQLAMLFNRKTLLDKLGNNTPEAELISFLRPNAHNMGIGNLQLSGELSQLADNKALLAQITERTLNCVLTKSATDRLLNHSLSGKLVATHQLAKLSSEPSTASLQQIGSNFVKQADSLLSGDESYDGPIEGLGKKRNAQILLSASDFVFDKAIKRSVEKGHVSALLFASANGSPKKTMAEIVGYYTQKKLGVSRGRLVGFSKQEQ